MPQIVLICEYCSHLFRRNLLKVQGRTRCPSCKKRTKRKQASRDEANKQAIQEFMSRERSEKKKSMASLMNLNAVLSMDAIKADQIPNSRHEALFKSKCAEKGWVAHRPSWPDFIVETENRLVAVEVKGPGDSVSKTQAATFSLLESMGVPVYIWKNTAEGQGRLSRWNPEIERRAA